MKIELQTIFQDAIRDLGVTDIMPEVTISDDPSHGEYTTNIALLLSKRLEKSPMDIALQVQKSIRYQVSSVRQEGGYQKSNKKDQKSAGKKDTLNILSAIDHVEVVAPGFINIFLTESALSTALRSVLKDKERYGTAQTIVPLHLDGVDDQNPKRIMVEFAHPNTHKAFHIGHLRNITTGESIVRLLEASGHEVIRVNYQGDVGMHIAKCLYGILKVPSTKYQVSSWKDAARLSLQDRVEYLGEMYAAGSQAYEADDEAKKAVGEINKQIYAKDPAVYPLYQETRQWSLDYFDSIYKRVGTHYDRLYFESEFYELGKKFVAEGIERGVFEKSDGAIIFPGEKYGVHNRVFITKEGNATYEGKEIGLGRTQLDEYHPDVIVHVVGPEQAGYFQVLFQALAHMFPDAKGREYHKIYGWVKLKHGKMSSRTGQVVLGEWLLDEAKKSIYEILAQNRSEYTDKEKDEIAEKAAIAAVKYAFLKVSTNQEIAFDLKESVSFDGDSGPYLLYSYSRAKSVIRKAEGQYPVSSIQYPDTGHRTLDTFLNPEERSLARLIMFFPEVVAQTVTELAPNTLCTYLFVLAQAFNLFYQKHTILPASGNVSSIQKPVSGIQPDTGHRTPDTARLRLALTAATAQVLHNGLYLLGISTVERM